MASVPSAGASEKTEEQKPQRVVALIPARGGSVSVPLKNIKPLNGRPLIDWAIRAALDSGCFSAVYCSTDHDAIEAEAVRAGALVHRRSAETATSTASTESAMLEFLEAHSTEVDVLCLIQATSPLVLPDHFREALDLFRREQADSLVTAVRAHRFLWRRGAAAGEGEGEGSAVAVNYDPALRPRRQDWAGELIENGAFYLSTTSLLLSTRSRLGGKVALYEMPEHTLCELDSEVDWEILQCLSKRFGHWPGAARAAGK